MIGIASDHGGYELKKELISYLNSLNYDVKDYGTYNDDSVDYPLYAFKIGEEISNKNIEKGILICKTGIGMSIAANKVKGIRCAKVDNIEEAILARKHNDSNVISFSVSKSIDEIKDIILNFLKTDFSNEERHIRRVKEITDYEY